MMELEKTLEKLLFTKIKSLSNGPIEYFNDYLNAKVILFPNRPTKDDGTVDFNKPAESYTWEIYGGLPFSIILTEDEPEPNFNSKILNLMNDHIEEHLKWVRLKLLEVKEPWKQL